MQEALELYEMENNDLDLYMDTALYPWQQELMKHINNKSDREVYWIVGQKTNEGKSYFQKYINQIMIQIVIVQINTHIFYIFDFYSFFFF